jgi:two-component system CheB/CheR fusion protein
MTPPDQGAPGGRAPREAGVLRSPYVVGIGASAGGLDALERFFENMPSASGIAFVLVQHLSPDFKSLMDEILARRTKLPIRAVENGMLVEADHIYLIPPKKEMIISEGRLLLSDRERDHDLSLPIDVFFRSLARDCGPRAVAIVLSGSGSDGSRGICSVHDHGGLVLVQDTQTAQFDGMPRTARDTGVADAVLAPHEMPKVLLDHVNGSRIPLRERTDEADRGMGAVYRMLETTYGIDFTHYKPSTVTRRIERRIQLARIDDLSAYVERLRKEHEELDSLYRDLLIGVTRFFRNEEAFLVMNDRVLPDLFRKAQDKPLRVWVAGCATGEEVYTLAILLHELAPRFGGRQVKIFATDVHPGSLEFATRGLYTEESVAKVSNERLERYFLRRGTSYQVVPDLRQMVVFAPHNVIKDAPFTRVDLVSCRNLLIYLQPPAQQKALGHFHFALNRGGVVFLGPSESPGLLAHDFDAIDKRWRIYRKYTDTRTHVAASQPDSVRGDIQRRETTRRPSPISPAPRQSVTQLLAAYDLLLDEYMPPGFLVNEQRELVHAFGGASKFLRLHDGRLGLDVVEMVDRELRVVLLSGLKRALTEPSSIVFKGVCIPGSDGAEVNYKVSIRKLSPRNSRSPLLLVSFERMEGAPRRPEPREDEIDLGQVSREQLGILEAELSYTKESLQTTTEELESSNEELQAANEELVASNEELQSTNEELQSVNEELYTVNAEYQRKIAALIELTNDMENLLSSTDIGTIFLDRELKIRKFTARIAESYSLLPQDIGRSIETFAHSLDDANLLDDLQSVLRSGEPVERELRSTKGQAYFLRVLPYRAAGSIEGVVLTLIDVSSLKAAEDALFHERHLLNSLLASVPDAIYFKDVRGRFIRANHAVAARLGLGEPRDAVGKTAFELPHQGALLEHQKDEEIVRTGEPQHYQMEKRLLADGSEEWDVVTRLPLRNGAGIIVGVIGIFRDVTQQKQAEEKIRQAVQRRDEFLAMLSHELRNPLGAVVAATSLLRKNRPEKRDMLLQVIERQSKHMARLLDDLLEASRVTQDKIELRKRVLDLRPVIKDAADSLRALMESRGHELAMDLDSRPMLVQGDDARLLQINVNLLSNAAKYTPRGGRIALEGKVDGEHAVVRVRDNGVGIPTEMLDTIFDLFVQSRRTLERAEGGLGLGLTLVRSLVRMHEGTVAAHSDGEGKGSEFVVRLPLATRTDPNMDPGPTQLSRAGVKLNGGAKILVVEDNPDARHILCDVLELAGFECHPAEDGDAALDLLERVRPDAAIVDIGLPVIDGFEFARRVRSDPARGSIYLIALTGYGRRIDREQALRAGFDEHLVKPVDPPMLLQLLGQESHAEAYSGDA